MKLRHGVLAAVGAVLLSGCAGTVVGAGAAAGVATVEDRGLSGALSDTKIRVQINEAWFRASEEMFRKVGLTIVEGRVLLTGVVPAEQAHIDAVRLTWQVAGVKDVYDEIVVSAEGEATIDQSRDIVIAQKLKAKLLFDKNIRNVNYDVDVVDAVIYVIGIAQDQGELDRVLAYARDIANVRRVVQHVVMKDDPKRVSG